MSRIGKKIIEIPSGVTVTVQNNVVTVQGPKGSLTLDYKPVVDVTLGDDNKTVSVSCESTEKFPRAYHGTVRALIANMVIGVTAGYEKRLELHGVGYVASVQNNTLQLRVGFANELQVPIATGLEVTCPDQQHIIIRGIDKQQVGDFASSVRALRKPEPYKGKGIRFFGEKVRRKVGKAVAK